MAELFGFLVSCAGRLAFAEGDDNDVMDGHHFWAAGVRALRQTGGTVNNLSTTCTVRRLFSAASPIDCFKLDPLSIQNVGKMQKYDKP